MVLEVVFVLDTVETLKVLQFQVLVEIVQDTNVVEILYSLEE